MAHGQLIAIAVRIAGMLIGLYALLSAIQWIIASEPFGSCVLPWLSVMLLTIWMLIAVALIVQPGYVVRRIAPGLGRASETRELAEVERAAIRLVGLYVLVQAATEMVEIFSHAFAAFILFHGRWSFWVETRPDVSLANAVTKTFVGCWFILGAQRVGELVRWARTAGRTWSLD